MDRDALAVITWALGTLTSLVILIGLAVRFVLMPYLRDNLVARVERVEVQVTEVHKQVTENHHTNAEPTIPDRIDDVRTEVRALARVLEGHLEAADNWTTLVVSNLGRIEALTARVTALEGPRHRAP